ncbi:uncharacterized protein rab11fip1b isoform X2 [Gadus macrocephalus]|uniref:uncharacterized protein rab11fip1b isoform X2 n=1 Tax=Gadus macrocephalus TaxID=80720 RepID=UPI0028CB8398|nr:uncharacterized protein rab11fip1b isoform X2 [Gadus macrocephalus]
MSLADQSQQWFPTSAQVTVLQARGLRIKGKNGTNDAYAIMQVAKDKFSTEVAEKSVAPMWKEQASFDLPPAHQGNAERGTLRVHVMHRALVGPDKPLGQAVVNLLDLHEVKSRNKTEWFKLVDKGGKADKERGEVLLDIQFMRNNMTASMFDLSGMDKSRSRLGKIKDKLRGKKKDGSGLDSVSAVVPSSFSQVLTDSEEEVEEEEEEEGVEGAVGATKGKSGKKKLKLKSLFSHKSTLKKNMSQSMSFLGPLPERNQTLSGSRSSGLNVEPSEGKKKFKFGLHKRSGSNDSKSSQASASVADPAQRGGPDGPRPGGHVYTEEPTARPGSRASSTFSLSSSGRGSMEDLHRGSVEGSFSSYDSLRVPRPQSSPWLSTKAAEEGEVEEEVDVSEYEQRRGKQEEEKARQEEQIRIERRREEEEQRKRLDEERIRREELEKREIEEQQRKYQRDEEDRIRREREEEERFRREEVKRREVEEERERINRMEEEEEKFRMKEEMVRIEKERAEREEKERREEERTRLEKEEEEKMKREWEEKQERIRIEKEKERLEEKYERERVRLEKMTMIQEREERRLREKELEDERFRMEKEREEERRVREEERLSEMQEREERKLREKELEEERFRMREEEERRVREEEERKVMEEEARMSEMQEIRLRERSLDEERFRMEKERGEEERRVREEEEERMSDMQEKEERRVRERELVEERFRMEKEREEEERRVEEETTRIEKAKKRQEEERILIEGEERRRREVAEEEEEQEVKRQEERERMRREEGLLEEERIKRQAQVRREEEERVQEQQRREDERRGSEEEGGELEEEFMTKETVRNTPFGPPSAHDPYLGPNSALTNKSPGGIESARRRVPVRSVPPSEDDGPPTPEGPLASRTADVPTARQSPASRRPPSPLFEPSNPFFEESESDEHLSGKKRHAPPPPSNQELLHDQPNNLSVSTVPFVSPLGGIKTGLHLDEGSDGEKDRPRAARTAPQPPKRHGPRIEPISSKEKTVQTVHATGAFEAPQPSKNTKGPAPAKPNPNITKVSAQVHDGRPEHAPRPALSFKDTRKNSNVSGPHTVTEQRPSTYGTNPFDEEDEDEEAQTPLDTDGSSSRVRSLKTVRAPPPPEDKESSPAKPSRNACSEATVSSSVRPTGPPPTGDASETQATVQPRRAEAAAEQAVRSETGTGPPTPSQRGHPVKPLRVWEQQSAVSSVSATPASNTPSEITRAGRSAVEVKEEEARGPFSQLTRGELILLLQKLQGQLTQRDHKISELEQYIDNLLVRIMEEEPSILMSMNALKH